jgi:DNA polymerase-3 subunit gamma/tau
MYILDEVHMLSKAASNAFLKTLEEPPSHCIFVLCTTDPEKMLETILSRCTKFNLKSPTQEVLAKYLKTVCEKEEVKIDKEAIQLIALSGDGSYRDSLSNLQKVLSFSGEKFTEKFVSEILGIPETSAIFEYIKSLDGLIEKSEGINVLKKIEEQGVDAHLFAKQVTYFARLALLGRHKILNEKQIETEYGEHILNFVTEILKNKKPEFNSLTLAKLLEAEFKAKNSSFPFLSYELLLL